MTMTDNLDIPEFLRRQKDEPKRKYDPIETLKARKSQRPANWFVLTKGEQNGTAEPATIALRKAMERDKQEKQTARFAHLKEVAAESKTARTSATPKPATAKKAKANVVKTGGTKYGPITEGGAVLFSFDATSSANAREIFSAMRKRGDVKGHVVKSLRRIKPDDKGVGGKSIPHKEVP